MSLDEILCRFVWDLQDFPTVELAARIDDPLFGEVIEAELMRRREERLAAEKAERQGDALQ